MLQILNHVLHTSTNRLDCIYNRYVLLCSGRFYLLFTIVRALKPHLLFPMSSASRLGFFSTHTRRWARETTATGRSGS